MMDGRFRRHWDRWQALKREGMAPSDFLASASDETLVELLACRTEGTDIERNIIATELTNRISRFHRSVEGHSDAVRGLVDENKGALRRAQAADARLQQETDAFESETGRTSRYSRRATREGGW